MIIAVLVDTHCHLYFDTFENDREAVLARMSQAGVLGAIVAGIDPASNTQAHALAAEYPALRFSVGLHPSSEFPPSFDPPRDLGHWWSAEPAPVAVGECGLDAHWDTNPLAAQAAVFAGQLRFAQARGLPVIVHTREADQQTREVLEQVPGVRGVLHCFNGSPLLLDFALTHDWYVSFAGNVTFPKAQALRDAARQVPLNRLLVETDAPFLAPQPVRGRRCEPAHLPHTARCLAQLRDLPEEQFEQIQLANSQACFNTSWLT